MEKIRYGWISSLFKILCTYQLAVEWHFSISLFSNIFNVSEKLYFQNTFSNYFKINYRYMYCISMWTNYIIKNSSYRPTVFPTSFSISCNFFFHPLNMHVFKASLSSLDLTQFSAIWNNISIIIMYIFLKLREVHQTLFLLLN